MLYTSFIFRPIQSLVYKALMSFLYLTTQTGFDHGLILYRDCFHCKNRKRSLTMLYLPDLFFGLLNMSRFHYRIVSLFTSQAVNLAIQNILVHKE